jgi:nitroreductase
MAAVQKLLNLPDGVQPLCIIPIGHPAEKKFRESRFDPARHHQNKW